MALPHWFPKVVAQGFGSMDIPLHNPIDALASPYRYGEPFRYVTPLRQIWTLLHTNRWLRRSPALAYVCACFSELAYLHLTDRELDDPGRYKWVPSLAFQALARAGARFDLTTAIRLDFPNFLFASDNFVYAGFKVGEIAVVAIRGTKSPYDMLVDLMAWKRSDPATGRRVHRGFGSEAERATPLLHTHLIRLGGIREVIFTGHSLGGALAGVLHARWPAQGTPTFTKRPSGRIYRYYVSGWSQRQRIAAGKPKPLRLCAPPLEAAIASAVATIAPFADAVLERVDLGTLDLTLWLTGVVTPRQFEVICREASNLAPIQTQTGVKIVVALPAPARGGTRLRFGDLDNGRDAHLTGALRRGHSMLHGNAPNFPDIRLEKSPPSPYEFKVSRLAFLAPELQRAILSDGLALRCSLEAFLAESPPLSWRQQREWVRERLVTARN